MSTNNHWSQLRAKVEVMGVNGIVTIPLLLWIMRPMSISTFLLFLGTLAFVVYFEKFQKLDLMYVPAHFRYKIIGGRTVPRTQGFDI